MKLTETAVQYAIFRELASGHSLIVPNYTPRHWFECDVFSVTKGGFFHEHEIKLTAADFAADANKFKPQTLKQKRDGDPHVKKHDLLMDRHGNGQVCFWFVVTEELASVQIPGWSGLKVIRDHGHFIKTAIVHPAPRLHDNKVLPLVVDHAKGVCYWRFWRERHKRMGGNL